MGSPVPRYRQLGGSGTWWVHCYGAQNGQSRPRTGQVGPPQAPTGRAGPRRGGRGWAHLLLQAVAARGGQLLLLQRAAVAQRQAEHLVLQLQHLVEVGADLALHAAVVGLQLAQALGAGLGLAQALLQPPALLREGLLLPLLLAQLLLQAADGPGQALRQLGRLHEPCGGGAGADITTSLAPGRPRLCPLHQDFVILTMGFAKGRYLLYYY